MNMNINKAQVYEQNDAGKDYIVGIWITLINI